MVTVENATFTECQAIGGSTDLDFLLGGGSINAPPRTATTALTLIGGGGFASYNTGGTIATTVEGGGAARSTRLDFGGNRQTDGDPGVGGTSYRGDITQIALDGGRYAGGGGINGVF